jgi:hypothetical protein
MMLIIVIPRIDYPAQRSWGSIGIDPRAIARALYLWSRWNASVRRLEGLEGRLLSHKDVVVNRQ